ncbi:MAG: hypothetical protein QM751_09455 [Paludibacteraceae bacterium]
MQPISRSSVYRCLVKNGINKVPQEQKDKAKKFKSYQPGYLHIDVACLPKFNGESAYLFVAMDRATRALYYKIYDDKKLNQRLIFLMNASIFFLLKSLRY